jgi:hypothetical protein
VRASQVLPSANQGTIGNAAASLPSGRAGKQKKPDVSSHTNQGRSWTLHFSKVHIRVAPGVHGRKAGMSRNWAIKTTRQTAKSLDHAVIYNLTFERLPSSNACMPWHYSQVGHAYP